MNIPKNNGRGAALGNKSKLREKYALQNQKVAYQALPMQKMNIQTLPHHPYKGHQQTLLGNKI